MKQLYLFQFVFVCLLAGDAAVSEAGTVCVASPDAGAIEMQAEPGRPGKQAAVARGAKMVRIDTVTLGTVDWIQLEADGKRGWVLADRLVCRATDVEAKARIAADAARVLAALRSRNLRELARYVHPVKGVRFSPYAFVDKKANIRYTAVSIQRAFLEKSPRVWGSYDGSGDPIRLTFSDYFKRFVYDRDFAGSTKTSCNGAPAIKGTTHDNSREEYPSAIVFESHVAGSAPDKAGMDWRALRLVFEQHRGRWYLAHVIHDQWTI